MPWSANLRGDDSSIILDLMSLYIGYTHEKGSSDTNRRLVQPETDV